LDLYDKVTGDEPLEGDADTAASDGEAGGFSEVPF